MNILISLVVNNPKGEVLICQRENLLEFPLAELHDGITIENCLMTFGKLSLGISAIPVKALEVVYKENSYFEKMFKAKSFTTNDIAKLTTKDIEGATHVIIEAELGSGNMTKGYYSKIAWRKICDLELDDFDLYGKRVLDKIKNCEYCRYIHDKKEDLDFYFDEVFTRLSRSKDIQKILSSKRTKPIVYELAFNQCLTHIRAFFIESERLNKNITVQNYFRIYKRPDLAEYFDKIFSSEIYKGVSIRKMIRESVDKYIVHYDKPNKESEELFVLCKALLSPRGKMPLWKFMSFLDYFFMLTTTEMWYYSGELGLGFDELNPYKKKIAHLEYDKLIDDFKQSILC